MEKKFLQLDEEAEKLFRELGGIDTSNRNISSAGVSGGLIEGDKEQDQIRTMLMQLLHLVTSYFKEVRFHEGVKDSEKDIFQQISEIIRKLSKRSDISRFIYIKFRGFPSDSKASAKADYVIEFGNIAIDLSVATAMTKRLGLQYSHLSKQLDQSFQMLSNHSINTLYMEIPELDASFSDKLNQLWNCICIISRFPLALKRDIPIAFERKGENPLFLPIVLNEKGLPDQNLTLVAGLNNIEPKAMQEMIRKIYAWMQDPKQAAHTAGLTSVYNAIFEIPTLRAKLKKPPIEINNIKWMLMDGVPTKVSEEKAAVARLVMDKLGKSPQLAAEAIQSVYGSDYQQIDTKRLGDRVKIASHLLSKIDGESDSKIQTEILVNIKDRFEEIPEEVFDQIQVKKSEIRFQAGEKETVVADVPKKLVNIIGFYKIRSGIKTKLKKMTREVIDFDAQDYEVLAKDFKISAKDAKDLVTLLKSCFDNQGHFRKSVFQKYIPEFAKYESKVFEFLWFYLKETPHRNDRVAFLNSFQLLILQMKKPEIAIKLIFKEVFDKPTQVNFTDRNAFMLMNMLVRTYNKEMNLDIEMTPEEVLLVVNGLNQTVCEMVVKMIEKDQEKIIQKIESIHELLEEAIHNGTAGNKNMSYRFLLALEREALIFLALVGGRVSRTIIRSAILKYGKTNNPIYQNHSNPMIPVLLVQHLRVIVRCLNRMAEREDYSLMEAIQEQEDAFKRLSKGPVHEDKVRRLMEWVQIFIETLIGSPKKVQNHR